MELLIDSLRSQKTLKESLYHLILKKFVRFQESHENFCEGAKDNLWELDCALKSQPRAAAERKGSSEVQLLWSAKWTNEYAALAH